jgi:protein-L-isoaspartate(D-aspartate) O-methyltransferase
VRVNIREIVFLVMLVCLCACQSRSDAGGGEATAATAQPTQDEYLEARLSMVREQIELRGVDDPVVLEAMRLVERHRFVPEEFIDQAYDDHPLPIGYGQTISQPYIVALMTRALGVEPGDKVLEIGTGSGYQAAVLAEMGVETYTIEIVAELAAEAAQRLKTLDYSRVRVVHADGYFGWEEHAPFDAIIVTAAPDHVPQPLINQLAEGGRLVIPIGPAGMVQTLWQFEKINGELSAENLGAVRFVPFTRSAP